MRSPEAVPGPKLAVLGALALAMGHDVENLVLGARACVRRLGHMELAAEERQRYVDATVDALEQMRRMHGSLLEATLGSPRSVEPGTLLDRGLDRVRPLARERGVTLEGPAKGDASIRCRDDGDLSCALTAVLLDLVRALSPGGHVVVESRRRDDHLVFELRGRQPPDVPRTTLTDFALARALPALGARLEVGALEPGAVVATLPVPLAILGNRSEDARSDAPEPSGTHEDSGG